MKFNLILSFLFCILPLSNLLAEEQDIDPLVKEAINLKNDDARRAQILSLLPQFIGKSAELNAMLDSMPLEALDAAYCRELAKFSMQLERHEEFNPPVRNIPRAGDHMFPDDRIHNWVAGLALPDVQAFYSYVGSKKLVGPPRDFWDDLVKWAEINQLESLLLSDIKQVLTEFKAKQSNYSEFNSPSKYEVPSAHLNSPADAKVASLPPKKPIRSKEFSFWLPFAFLFSVSGFIFIFVWRTLKKR